MVAFKSRMMQPSAAPVTDWLTSSTVHGDIAAVCVKPASGSATVVDAIAAVKEICSLSEGGTVSVSLASGDGQNQNIVFPS